MECVCMIAHVYVYVTVIISLDTNNQLVFVMQIHCVFM